MEQLQGIGAHYNQRFSYTFKGEQIIFVLRYAPMVESFFIDVSYKDFSVKGLRVVQSYNILKQWERIIPFGIAIVSENNLEPLLIDDFLDNTKMYIIDNEEYEVLGNR